MPPPPPHPGTCSCAPPTAPTGSCITSLSLSWGWRLRGISAWRRLHLGLSGWCSYRGSWRASRCMWQGGVGGPRWTGGGPISLSTTHPPASLGLLQRQPPYPPHSPLCTPSHLARAPSPTPLGSSGTNQPREALKATLKKKAGQVQVVKRDRRVCNYLPILPPLSSPTPTRMTCKSTEIVSS